jgi:hypothetical protein
MSYQCMIWLSGGLFFVNLLRTRYSRGLNKFNGPFLVSFTNLWKVWYAYKSSQEQTYVNFHRKYGDIVRIGPNDLSFAGPQVLHDIYGPKGLLRRYSGRVIFDVTIEIRNSMQTHCG